MLPRIRVTQRMSRRADLVDGDTDETLRAFAARWPTLARIVRRTPLCELDLEDSATIRVLDYLEANAPLVGSVRGFTNARLGALLVLAAKNRDAFLDKRAELEILRALYRTFPADLEWVSETERGVKPDIRLTAAGAPVNFEVTRLRLSHDETTAEEQRNRIEKAVTSRAFPFDIVVFLDVSRVHSTAYPATLVEDAGIRAMEFAERLSRNQDRISELIRLRGIDQSEREEARQAYVLKQIPGAAPHEVMRGLLAIEMRPTQAKCEEELTLDGDSIGSLTAYYIGERAGSCTICVFGPLPDESRVLWARVVDECRQLPRGDIGVVVLWVDRQADLLDLYSPVGYATGHEIEWKADLQTLFADYRNRCSAIVFISGFERELVANPLADCPLEPWLAERLALSLQLQAWGYLDLHGH